MAGCKHACPQCTLTEPAAHESKKIKGVLYHTALPGCHPRVGESQAFNLGPPPSRESQMDQASADAASAHT
jgi:hypothetical protein